MAFRLLGRKSLSSKALRDGLKRSHSGFSFHQFIVAAQDLAHFNAFHSRGRL